MSPRGLHSGVMFLLERSTSLPISMVPGSSVTSSLAFGSLCKHCSPVGNGSHPLKCKQNEEEPRVSLLINRKAVQILGAKPQPMSGGRKKQ